MKTRTKFWTVLFTTLYITLLIIVPGPILFITAVIIIILFLTAWIHDTSYLGKEEPSNTPSSYYTLFYKVNWIYWVNVLNCWLDKFDKDE